MPWLVPFPHIVVSFLLVSFVSCQIKDKLLALSPKIRAKETDRKRQREHAKSEEERHSALLSKFRSDVGAFESLTKQIESFAKNKDKEGVAAIEEQIVKLRETIQETEARTKKLAQLLDKLKQEGQDQQRRKKLIEENISLFQGQQRIAEIEKDLKEHQEELEAVEGHDTCQELYDEATAKKRHLEARKARLEGRRGGFIDQIRGLKVRR